MPLSYLLYPLPLSVPMSLGVATLGQAMLLTRLTTMLAHGSQTGTSGKASTAADNAFCLASESLLKLGKHWAVVPCQTKDLTKFLHDFYASWVSPILVWLILPDICQDYAERMGRLAGADGLDKAARALRVKIEEAAQPYAEIDWLVTFPTIVTDAHHKCLILYTAALCRARAAVIDDCIINCKWNFNDYLLDPYKVATCEIQDLHDSCKIGNYDRQWILSRLRRDQEEVLKEQIRATAVDWAEMDD
jgi:hypothetical protein